MTDADAVSTSKSLEKAMKEGGTEDWRRVSNHFFPCSLGWWIVDDLFEIGMSGEWTRILLSKYMLMV